MLYSFDNRLIPNWTCVKGPRDETYDKLRDFVLIFISFDSKLALAEVPKIQNGTRLKNQ